MAFQVDSSSPCDCLFPLERAEATTSLACADSRDTLAQWWSANEIEVSCKAVRVFLLVRKLVKVWMRCELRNGWSRVAGCRQTCISWRFTTLLWSGVFTRADDTKSWRAAAAPWLRRSVCIRDEKKEVETLQCTSLPTGGVASRLFIAV